MFRALTISTVAFAALVLAACGNDQATPSATVADVMPWPALIDPNTADAAALGKIPGLPSAAVDAIMAQRPFSTPTQLNDAIASVVGPDALSGIYNAMFVKVNLNTASNDDLLLIPNSMKAGKLAHEFEEYRPYKDMAQFRREIGKYVDEKELARLERYVTLD